MTTFQKIFIGVLSLVMLCVVGMMTVVVAWYVMATPLTAIAEASIATPTPKPPTATPVPPTPTPSITTFGQAAELGQWKIKVVDLQKVDSLRLNSGDGFSTYRGTSDYLADEARTIYLVELELTNTTELTGTLMADPQQIEVVDLGKKSHRLIGVTLGSSRNGNFYSNDQLLNGVGLVSWDSEGNWAVLETDVLDDTTNKWILKLSGRGLIELTIAFDVPAGTQVTELRWPKLRPFSLEQ